jgi:prepilin-type N-terminal cleavage/methylation domain-containing protein
MRNKGFTLVEIIVAMVVLALLSTGLFSVFVSSRYIVRRSRSRLVALEVAKNVIENKRQYIRANTWYLGNASDPLNPTGAWSAPDTTTYPPYSVRFKIDPGPSNTDYRKISVQVQWNDITI